MTTVTRGQRILNLIPGRKGLDEKTWRARHNFMLTLLWAHVPFLAIVGLIQGNTLEHVAVESLPMVIPAAFAMTSKNRTVASMAVAFGLLSSSGILVHYTNGLIESHFHFFVMVTVVALYQDWKPLVLGVGYVALQHGIIGVITPEYVYNHPAALEDPVKWALIHATYILFLVIVQLSHWRLAEKADADRSASEERFRRSFEEAPIGMAILDANRRFIQVNKAMGEILGYEKDKLVNTALTSLTHADDHLELEEAWEAMESSKDNMARAELRCLTISGRSIWAKISLSMLPETANQPEIIVLQLEDATQAHSERERLTSLVKGKDEFVASVADEIHQPIQGLLTVISDSRKGNPDQEDNGVLSHVEDQAREIEAVVTDLIVSARSESSPVSVVPRSLNVEQLCYDAMAEIPGARNIPTFTNDTTIWADPVRAKQIMKSLIGNAVRYGGPEVEVKARRSGPDTVMQVIDNGPEIPASEQERIFRADLRNGYPVTQPTTVGLGLTVARTLARQMGGDITYKRTGDGRSIFEVRLPSESLAAPYHSPTAFTTDDEDLASEPA